MQPMSSHRLREREPLVPFRPDGFRGARALLRMAGPPKCSDKSLPLAPGLRRPKRSVKS